MASTVLITEIVAVYFMVYLPYIFYSWSVRYTGIEQQILDIILMTPAVNPVELNLGDFSYAAWR